MKTLNNFIWFKFFVQRRKIASLCISRIYKVSKKGNCYFLNLFFIFHETVRVRFDQSRDTCKMTNPVFRWFVQTSTGFEGFQTSASCRRLWMIWERLSTTFTSILVASGADVASGFACTDISLWFPIFSVTLLLANITIAHLLLSRQGLEENLSLVKKNL